jgi:hypothetical protein
VGIPVSALTDAEFGARQAAFRSRVQDSGLVTQPFTDPATLGQLMERSLRELAGKGRRSGGTRTGQAQGTVVVGEIPHEPLGFQPRQELLCSGHHSVRPFCSRGARRDKREGPTAV